MRETGTWRLVLIIVVALVSLFVVLNINHPAWVESLLFWQPEGQREIALRLGLDLQGGLKVLLAADPVEGQEFDQSSMEAARRIVESRVNSLGLTEPVVQAQGERRIIVELPGVENPEQAVETIRGTALLEFVDAGGTPLLPDTVITTTLGGPEVAGTDSLTATASVTPTEPQDPDRVYETIMTGADLANVGLDAQQNEYIIPFELTPEGAETFAQYTASHVGQFLCIVLDKTVISCPRIQGPIPEGRGMISGAFTLDEARQLAIQLRYGALPIPLRVESFNRVGATLGERSVERSVRAAVIGLSVVLLFMLVYYRLPGAVADVALVIYVLINLALYKLVPVTLTLPGIAGFVLSAGMAVDANILIFERMKEELRAGRTLARAVEMGFDRAWPSIRDSQVSTLIVTAVLFFFGTNFGASIVKGFAITLALGVTVNLFTAVFATRTFMVYLVGVVEEWLSAHKRVLGV
jgi:protein-export membrane protein SecD